MYFLGIDLGSSSVKLSVFDGATGKSLVSTFYPKQEMDMISTAVGFAEQEPDKWWECVVEAAKELSTKVDFKCITAIGISYQMHGLVVVNKDKEVLRPSIIWCDSRAVSIGEKAFEKLGSDYCNQSLLNSPGNFTASKLKWVQENEPETYDQIHKIMLPGDFIAMKLTGDITTTASGLSEGVFWDYTKDEVSQELLNHYGFDKDLIPDIVSTFGNQGKLSKQAANLLGLSNSVIVAYRAGDQPNNAFSLNVLNPGEFAATAGTSGVIYGIASDNASDELSRVNTFMHVNNTSTTKRNGVLLCVNGTGILYSWIRKLISGDAGLFDYEAMNELAKEIEIGAAGLRFYPFGNGTERMLCNQNVQASVQGLSFNSHHKGHIVRAAKEGIVYALNYGFKVMSKMGLESKTIKAGKANLFLSPIFREAFVNVTNTSVELYNTDGAEGAARGAAVGIGYYENFEEAFASLECLNRTEPEEELTNKYKEAYASWEEGLQSMIS